MSNTSRTGAGSSGDRRLRLGGLAVMGLSAALVLGLTAASQWLHQDARGQLQRQTAERVLQQAGGLLQQALDEQTEQMDRWAASPLLQNLPATVPGLQREAERLQNLRAGARLHLIHQGETLPRSNLSFTAQDQALKARDGTPAPALLGGGQEPLILVSARRTHDRQTILVMEQPLEGLTRQLRRIDALQGGMVLSQTGHQRPLLQWGTGASVPAVATLALPHGLQLTYHGEPLPADALASLPWVLSGLVLVLLMVILALFLRRLDLGLSADLKALQQKLSTGGRIGRHTFAHGGLEQLDQELDAFRSSVRQAAPPGVPVAAVPEPAPAVPVMPSPELEELVALSDDLPEPPASPFPPVIVRADRLHGLVGPQLTPDLVERLGQALGSKARGQGLSSVVVGRDNRSSSPLLSEALIRGLVRTGCEVLDLGLTPTPVLHYACHSLDTSTGVMISGGIGAARANGLHLTLDGRPLVGEDLLLLRERAMQQRFAEGEGRVKPLELRERYLSTVIEDISLARPLKVVVDGGNGAAGSLAARLFRMLRCDVVSLFCEPDGHFPNHHPDPSRPENLHALISTVREQGAQIGLAFDVSGTMITAVTPAGEIIWPDRLLMLFARDLLTRQPGAEILLDAACSRETLKLISRMGGRAHMGPGGGARLALRMKESDAVLAGDAEGHLCFSDRWHGMDDALYAGARLLELLSQESASADSVFARLKTGLCTPPLVIPLPEPIPEDGAASCLDALARRCQSLEGGSLSTAHGVRVEFEDGFGAIRPADDQPGLLARFEGRDKAALQRITAVFRAALQNADPRLKLPF